MAGPITKSDTAEALSEPHDLPGQGHLPSTESPDETPAFHPDRPNGDTSPSPARWGQANESGTRSLPVS